MSFAKVSLSLVGIAGVVAVALAGGIIWLMMTQMTWNSSLAFSNNTIRM